MYIYVNFPNFILNVSWLYFVRLLGFRFCIRYYDFRYYKMFEFYLNCDFIFKCEKPLWRWMNQMELLALIEGLKLVEDNNLFTLEINIDSREVIAMLKSEDIHYNILLDICRLRIRRLGGSRVIHYYREQNNMADAMTKFGALTNNLKEATLFEVPPICVQEAVWTDIVLIPVIGIMMEMTPMTMFWIWIQYNP